THIHSTTRLIQLPPPIPSFTQQLPNNPNNLIPFQIHQTLIPLLKHTLSPYHNLTIINQHILKPHIPKPVDTHLQHSHNIILVPNLPY
ncbi:rRNA adenine N-6-methyltransferase family protein, partial [Staphylococcus epidermidis]|uniref:rRNA adenine N-6-methyltransferase family protein n=1 Tax=Staphylococcus epidermidis TaxID=1282 RepID=UPI0037D9D26C